VDVLEVKYKYVLFSSLTSLNDLQRISLYCIYTKNRNVKTSPFKKRMDVDLRG